MSFGFRPVFGILMVLMMSTGCAYRFSNLSAAIPPDVRTVAIESVFDTSHEVLPHEILWDELQSAFARNGRLRLVRRDVADALVRAHIVAASLSPGSENPILADPAPDDPPLHQGGMPPAPNLFKPLTRAGQYAPKAQLSVDVMIEVLHLRTGTSLLTKKYSMGSGFYAVRPDAISRVNNNYLRFEEAQTTHFRIASRGLAQSLITDLMVRI